MKEADRARARRIEERIRSRRIIEGPYSPFGRARHEAINPMATSIAMTYPNSTLDEDDLRRCVVLFLGRHPAAGLSHQETTALVNRRHLNEQAKVVVRGVTKEFLNKLSPEARLHYANTGDLPEKYIRKDLLDD